MPANLQYSRIFFSLAFILILYLFYRLLKPFLITVILALTLASLFYPNYQELNRKLRGKANLSSALMCLIVTVLIIIPLFLFFVALLDEFTEAYASFRAQAAAGRLGQELDWPDSELVEKVRTLFSRSLGLEGLNVTLLAASLLERVADYLLDHYASILGGIGAFFFKFAIMIFSMFFFFRDGESFVNELKRLVPLAPEHEDLVLIKLKDVTYATFLGIFATGILQGLVAGIVFFSLGISNPVLWGTATAVFSVIPILGTSTVWFPMACYLGLSGEVTKGVILFLLGALGIALVDNLVRPLIIEGKARGMHLLLVFFSLAGGLILFGPSGLVLGPLVAALFLTFLEIYKMEFRDELG